MSCFSFQMSMTIFQTSRLFTKFDTSKEFNPQPVAAACSLDRLCPFRFICLLLSLFNYSLIHLFIYRINFRTPFTLTHITGLIRRNTALLADRPRLTSRRLSYRLIGTRPFLRSVSVWRSTNSPDLSSSTNRSTLYTRWLRTEYIETHHWVVRDGRRCLVRRVPYNAIVTGKA